MLYLAIEYLDTGEINDIGSGPKPTIEEAWNEVKDIFNPTSTKIHTISTSYYKVNVPPKQLPPPTTFSYIKEPVKKDRTSR